MFYGVRLLFCTYKEGTVIREQLVAGEKKEPNQEYTVLLKVSCGDMDREGRLPKIIPLGSPIPFWHGGRHGA